MLGAGDCGAATKNRRKKRAAALCRLPPGQSCSVAGLGARGGERNAPQEARYLFPPAAVWATLQGRTNTLPPGADRRRGYAADERQRQATALR